MLNIDSLTRAFRASPRIAKRSLMASIVVASLSWTGCTVIAQESASQCSAPSDCLRFGTGYTCGPENTCIAIDGYCDSNRTCLSRAPDTFCKKSSTDPSANRCQPLFSAECTGAQFLGTREELEQDPIMLGILWEGSWGPDLQAGVNGLAMARNDFAQGGGVVVGGQRRGVVFVGCDIPENNYDAVVPATTHLTQTIGVPVIIGPLIPGLLSRAVTTATGSPAFFTPDPLTSIGRPRAPSGAPLVYGSISQAEEARAIAAFVSVWEKKVLEKHPAPVKLALMWEGDSGSANRVRAFEEAAKINGAPVGSGNPDYRNITTGNPAEKFNPQSAAAKAIVDVKAMNPDIIVTLGAAGISIIPILEDEGLHPYWLGTSEINSGQLFARVSGTPDLSSRVSYPFYTAPVRSLRDVWAQRFRLNYPDTPAFELAYANFDIFYTLAFSLSRVQGDLTGASVSEALQRSFGLDGAEVEATPEAIRSGFDLLANPATKIKLSGILTNPVVYGADGDLDRPQLHMVCLEVTKDSATGASRTDVSATKGATYDVKTRTIIGEYKCE